MRSAPPPVKSSALLNEISVQLQQSRDGKKPQTEPKERSLLIIASNGLPATVGHKTAVRGRGGRTSSLH